MCVPTTYFSNTIEYVDVFVCILNPLLDYLSKTGARFGNDIVCIDTVSKNDVIDIMLNNNATFTNLVRKRVYWGKRHAQHISVTVW